jgi:hypothetical protein
MRTTTTNSAATTSSQWIKRAIAAGLLTLAPAFMALGLSPTSEADPGTGSSITTSHIGPKPPTKTIKNGGQKHHHHHRHYAAKHHGSNDSGE